MFRTGNLDRLLLISLLTLILFTLLYLFRFIDDNALTNWRWVFNGVRLERVLLLVFLGTVLSALPAKVVPPERYAFPFVLSFLIVLPLWREPEAILDTSRYFLQAKHLEVYGVGYFFQEWGGRIRAWTDMPLLPFIYGLIFRHLGESRLYIQVFTTLLFSSTVLLTSLIGRKLWDTERGFYAGLFLMAIPYLPTQVPLMLVDVPTMFFLTLSLYTFLQALEKGGPVRIFIAASAIFLTIFTKYSTWLMLAVIPLTALAYRPRGPGANIRSTAAVLITAALLASAVFLWKFDVFWRQIDLLLSYQWSGLRRWQEGYGSTFFLQTHPFVSLAALYAVYAAVRRKDARFLVAGWFAIFVFFLQVKRIRYTLPLFPFLALMASYGLNEIRDRELKGYICYCAVATSLVVLYTLYLPFLQRMSTANLMEAGAFLDSLEAETVTVYTLPQRRSIANTAVAVPILDLFTDKRLLYCQEPRTVDERVRRSPLRFTWDFRRPDFYSREGCFRSPVFVMISSRLGERAPEGLFQDGKALRELRSFGKYTGIFRYKTLVTIYSIETSLSEHLGSGAGSPLPDRTRTCEILPK